MICVSTAGVLNAFMTVVTYHAGGYVLIWCKNVYRNIPYFSYSELKKGYNLKLFRLTNQELPFYEWQSDGTLSSIEEYREPSSPTPTTLLTSC